MRAQRTPMADASGFGAAIVVLSGRQMIEKAFAIAKLRIAERQARAIDDAQTEEPRPGGGRGGVLCPVAVKAPGFVQFDVIGLNDYGARA